MSLSGRVAIVTGSGRGPGLAYGGGPGRQGDSVVINGIDVEVAAERVGLIETDGGQLPSLLWWAPRKQPISGWGSRGPSRGSWGG